MFIIISDNTQTLIVSGGVAFAHTARFRPMRSVLPKGMLPSREITPFKQAGNRADVTFNSTSESFPKLSSTPWRYTGGEGSYLRAFISSSITRTCSPVGWLRLLKISVMPWGVIPSISASSLFLTLWVLHHFCICKTKGAVFSPKSSPWSSCIFVGVTLIGTDWSHSTRYVPANAFHAAQYIPVSR